MLLFMLIINLILLFFHATDVFVMSMLNQ